MAQVENCGYAERYLHKGNEEIYAKEENLQYNGDHPTGRRDWLPCSIFLAVLARRTSRKRNTLTEYWYMIAINNIS
jgi:hypothetical protein